MTDMFSDPNTYKVLQYDVTDTIQSRLIGIALRLKKSKFIDDKTYTSITKYNSSIPKGYGLPKVHKDGIPMRPIIACYNSPAHEISVLLAGILKNLITNSRYNVKNSFEFVEKGKITKLNQHDKIASFDIKSLFANVPIDYALETIDNRWNEVVAHTNIPKLEFFEL